MKKVLQVVEHGGSDVFRFMELPSDEIQDNSIRIEVHAAGVNFADIMMRMGLYPEAPKPPFIPGYEVAGVVKEIRSSSSTLHIGNRVLSCTNFGGYSSEVIVPDYAAQKIPDHITFIEAAAIPVNFLTAWITLQEMARVRDGDRVLIPSAAGGVGLAAIQIAHQAGAHVVGLVGSPSKSDVVTSAGADEIWTNDYWNKATNGEVGGFDIILDSIGGENSKRCCKRLAPAGRVVSFGVSSMVQSNKRSVLKAISVIIKSPLFTPISLMNNNRGVYGLNLLPLYQSNGNDPNSIVNQSIRKILYGFEEKKYKVVIGKTFPLAEGGAAHDYLQSRANVGKVVLIV